MLRSSVRFLTLAAVAVATLPGFAQSTPQLAQAGSQSAQPASQVSQSDTQSVQSAPQSSYPTQTQAAPVERSAPDYNPGAPGYGRRPYGGRLRSAQPRVLTASPAQGIGVRSTVSVETVSATAAKVELRLKRGVANVTVHKPAHGTLIQVDLPGGQAALVHDGLYTFNADTNVVRVLKGKAEAYPGGTGKGVKVTEYHQIILDGPGARSMEFNPMVARDDLLASPATGDYGYAPEVYSYPYPYYAYGWGYPWGWGYPYFGVGFGYYGGWGRGFYGGRGFGGGRGFRR